MTNALKTVQATPLQLLQTAMEQKLDPDSLEKFMAMYERWEDRQAERIYNEAMNACQGEIMPVIRRKWNDQNKCNYVADEDVDEIIRPIYVKHGFSLSLGSDVSPLPDHYRCVCDVRHNGGHKERHVLDGQCDDKGMKGTPNKTGVQGVMSTMTYLKRNLKCLIFNIPIKGQDKDGQRPSAGQQPITDEQMATLNDWILQKEVPLDDFLKWAEVDSLARLPVSKYTTAIQMLKDRKPGARR